MLVEMSEDWWVQNISNLRIATSLNPSGGRIHRMLHLPGGMELSAGYQPKTTAVSLWYLPYVSTSLGSKLLDSTCLLLMLMLLSKYKTSSVAVVLLFMRRTLASSRFDLSRVRRNCKGIDSDEKHGNEESGCGCRCRQIQRSRLYTPYSQGHHVKHRPRKW